MIDTKALRRICEAAQPYSGSPKDWFWIGETMASHYTSSVAEYFTAAIKSLPALVDELDAARAELERLRGLVREYAEASERYVLSTGSGSARLAAAAKALAAAGKEIAK
jgi:hypothetical protein